MANELAEKKVELMVVGKNQTVLTVEKLNRLKDILAEESRELSRGTNPFIRDVADTRIGGPETVQRVERALVNLVERRKGWEAWYADTLGKVKEIWDVFDDAVRSEGIKKIKEYEKIGRDKLSDWRTAERKRIEEENRKRQEEAERENRRRAEEARRVEEENARKIREAEAENARRIREARRKEEEVKLVQPKIKPVKFVPEAPKMKEVAQVVVSRKADVNYSTRLVLDMEKIEKDSKAGKAIPGVVMVPKVTDKEIVPREYWREEERVSVGLRK